MASYVLIKCWSITIIADPPANIKKRLNSHRSKRLIKVQISNERIGQVDAIMRNLTDMGAGIELQTDANEGERVWITIKNLEPFCGTVAWSKQQKAGLQFDNPIDLTQLKITNVRRFEDEGIFKSADGYHVFDRFKPVSEMKRPALKPRK